MQDVLKNIKLQYPCRTIQIDQLWAYFGVPTDPFPSSLYLWGDTGTGKSSIITTLLSSLNIRYAIVNLVECYTSKILFESILNQLSGHQIDPKKGAPYEKCDTLLDFVENIRNLNVPGSVIVIDKAQELRDMGHNLLPSFLKLAELTNVPISVVLLSEIVFEKYYCRLNVREPIKIRFPQYTREELLEILAQDFDYVRDTIADHFNERVAFDVDFFRGYLNAFLSFFYRACRDLRELRFLSRKNFLKYCEPIAKKELSPQDSLALWKRISPVFTASAEVLYLRLETDNNSSGNLELPFYAKFLLIAAYLASYNSTQDDKRLFMKYHGKKTKTRKDVKQKSKVSEQLNTQMGPKPFNLDRLLAIFYAILDEKVGFNNHLLVQLSSLVELRLLSVASDGATLDGRRYKCNLNFETIQNVSRMVGFNIRKYLSDFSHM